MPDETTHAAPKENPFLAQRRNEMAAHQKRNDEMNALREAALKKTFVDESGHECTVIGFDPAKNLRGVTAPAYLLDFGGGLNPYVFCDEFNQIYKLKG